MSRILFRFARETTHVRTTPQDDHSAACAGSVGESPLLIDNGRTVSTIVFYVSGHGLGHASRQVEVLNTLQTRHPDLRRIVRTTAAPWLFDLTLSAPVDRRTIEVDTGIVQIDSLHLDERGTITQAARFHRTLEARADDEAKMLVRAGARLVVGDIPPLAFAAAERAGIPALAVTNFTWDWIYKGYPELTAETPDLLPTIRRAYASATTALRLPLAGGVEPFSHVVDVPFIPRRVHRDPADVRATLGLPADRPLVLVSFGGYGVRSLDWSALGRMARYGVVSTNGFPGATAPTDAKHSVLYCFDERQIYASGIRYEDLVAAVDVVVTKPGYSIVAECIANDTALLYTSRGRFVEYDVFVAEMPRYVRCAFIDQGDLMAGRWEVHLDRLLGQPAPLRTARVDGADVVADHVLDALTA